MFAVGPAALRQRQTGIAIRRCALHLECIAAARKREHTGYADQGRRGREKVPSCKRAADHHLLPSSSSRLPPSNSMRECRCDIPVADLRRVEAVEGARPWRASTIPRTVRTMGARSLTGLACRRLRSNARAASWAVIIALMLQAWLAA